MLAMYSSLPPVQCTASWPHEGQEKFRLRVSTSPQAGQAPRRGSRCTSSGAPSAGVPSASSSKQAARVRGSTHARRPTASDTRETRAAP